VLLKLMLSMFNLFQASHSSWYSSFPFFGNGKSKDCYESTWYSNHTSCSIKI